MQFTTKDSQNGISTHALLWGVLGTIAISATLKCIGKNKPASFIDKMAMPLLLLSLYAEATKTKTSNPEITTLWSE